MVGLSAVALALKFFSSCKNPSLGEGVTLWRDGWARSSNKASIPNAHSPLGKWLPPKAKTRAFLLGIIKDKKESINEIKK